MNEEEFINDFYKGNDYRKFSILQEIYRENTNLKQALNEIKEYCSNTSMTVAEYNELLKIIEKVSEDD